MKSVKRFQFKPGIICSRWGCLCLLFAAAANAQAQVKNIDEKPVPQSENGQLGQPQQTVWRIFPAAEAKPALAHPLRLPAHQLVPGNTMVPIQRALLQLAEMRDRTELGEQYDARSTAWTEEPLTAETQKELREYLRRHLLVINEVRRIERLSKSEYELGLEQLLGVEALEFLLPEYQQMRAVARLLQLEIRLAISEKRFDDALRDLRVIMRLAEAAGTSCDLLVSRLVGVAIASIGLEQVREGLAQEGMPNMYWGLAGLSPEMLDMRAAIEFETNILKRVFPTIAELPRGNVAPDEWRRLLSGALKDMQSIGGMTNQGIEIHQVELLAGIAAVGLAESSKRKLVEYGWDAEQVAAMGPSEAVVRASSYMMQLVQDDFGKWHRLPPAMRLQAIAKIEELNQTRLGNEKVMSDLGVAMASMLLPAVSQVMKAQMRAEQSVARLATVEAIRDYAAQHQQLPESLDDLQNLLPWPDPFTGKAFGYERISVNEAKLTSQPAYMGDRNQEVVLRLETTAR